MGSEMCIRDRPMVFAGIYPVDTDEYEELRASMEKLQLNDASLSFEPESSAALGFGFVLSEISNEGQNALIRDFTSLFLATFIFSILGAITLNPAWFYSIAIIYFGAAIFNLTAIYIHGTGYNSIYISEILLASWPLFLGLTIYFKGLKE